MVVTGFNPRLQAPVSRLSMTLHYLGSIVMDSRQHIVTCNELS